MRVLITGVCGFIGSHLADRFQDLDHQVWGIDNLETGRIDNFPGFHDLNIENRHELYEFANMVGPHLVIHCAASYKNPDRWHQDIDTNTTGTVNAVLVAKHHAASLVYFQTSLPPISSYAISKIAGEQYISLSGVPALVFRLANVYGPRNVSGPIPTFYRRLKAGEDCTVVNTRRDMVYVSDLVDLVTRAVKAGDRGKYDVCSGSTYPISALYDAVCQAMGEQRAARQVEAGEDDVAEMRLNPGQALARFGWTPKVGLHFGIREAVEWYERNGVADTYTHLKVA